MAEIKDKLVTVESLSTLNEHNKETYMTKVHPTGKGNLIMNSDGTSGGNGIFNGYVIASGNDMIDGLGKFAIYSEGNFGVSGTSIFWGTTNFMKELNVGGNINFVSDENYQGNIILAPHQYGDTLPEAGTAGRIFFKKLSE